MRFLLFLANIAGVGFALVVMALDDGRALWVGALVVNWSLMVPLYFLRDNEVLYPMNTALVGLVVTALLVLVGSPPLPLAIVAGLTILLSQLLDWHFARRTESSQ